MEKGFCYLIGENAFDIALEAFMSHLQVGYSTRLKNGILLYIDDMSLLNRSNVLTTILLEQGNGECRIEVISGGGAEGFFQLSMGSERRRVEKVMNLVDQVCHANEFRIRDYFVGRVKLK